ncbi:DUF6377 domain-containing protein [Mucilaginibacter roseus]|uniref:DUF6377 domain-containing protein n=1 Tax=Mucilaginibacter roseus TaxID=1528868 RepID=A0ABS8U4V8_9SPHI|nr:DUF6377 domain-containing protein [Mucilaginibacter roseus]MCD8742144.1 DUF6377 domain-containing protein [Mucilaginibacter roseus]
MTKHHYLLFITLVVFTSNCIAQNINADSMLTVLKKELTRKSIYDAKKENTIKQLKSRLEKKQNHNAAIRYNLCNQIFDCYRAYKFDSAFVYANKMIDIARESNNYTKETKSRILLGTILLNSGLYKEAFDVVEKLDPEKLSVALRSDYLILRGRLYSGIAEYNNDGYFTRLYQKQSKQDLKHAEITVASTEFEQTITDAYLPDSKRDKKLTPQFYYQYLTSHKLSEHGIAMSSTRLSFAYHGNNKVFFLALAAINDLRSATKETLAIFLLGKELYRQNRTSEAYLFMQEAVKNAKFYGARNREVQIESLLPAVANKLLAEKQYEKDRFVIVLLVIFIIALVLFFTLVIYRTQLLRIKANEKTITDQNIELKQVNEKLWESSRIKEELIGLFLKTCSTYIDTLDRAKRKILHSVKLGKFNEIKPLLDDVHIDREKEHLYETLDNAFLKIFPNFISSFNLLLSPEDQIWPKRGEALNPTLRIFALMRLGIHELPTVAKILGYSESTIYTYKIRVKAKALIQGPDFEKSIMDIKFIDVSE